MDVSKNKGNTQKRMVYNGKPLLKWMIWGKTHHLRKHPYTNMCILEATFHFNHVFFREVSKILPLCGHTHRTAVHMANSCHDTWLFGTPPQKKNSSPSWEKKTWSPGAKLIVSVLMFFGCSVWEIKIVWVQYQSETLRSTLVQMAWNIKDIKVPPVM